MKLQKKKIVKIGLAVMAVLVFLAFVIAIPFLKSYFSYTVLSPSKYVSIHIDMGGNSLVVVSKNKKQILIVDTKMGRGAKRLFDFVDSISNEAEITIVNTHAHYDHTEGNKLFKDNYGNVKIVAGNYTKTQWESLTTLEHFPDCIVSEDTDTSLVIDGDTITISAVGACHTFGDIVLYSRKKGILCSGDLIFNQMHPALFKEAGTDINTWAKTLNRLSTENDSLIVIPGHGAIGDEGLLNKMYDYFASISSSVHQEEQLAQLKRTYKNYFAIPSLTGFDNTVSFIREYGGVIPETPDTIH